MPRLNSCATSRGGPRGVSSSTCRMPVAMIAVPIAADQAYRIKRCVRAGLVASTGEARRQIRGGGLRVNDATLGDEKALITREALKGGGIVKLSLGRKQHVLLRAV